jgi:hypothetical protein
MLNFFNFTLNKERIGFVRDLSICKQNNNVECLLLFIIEFEIENTFFILFNTH